MIGALEAEWIKLRSVRANLILIIIALAIPILLTLLIAALAPFGGATLEREVFGITVITPALVAAYLCGVLGVLGIGQEYRHNTIRVTFAAQPNRSVVLAAKSIVYGVFGLVIGVLSLALSFATASICFAVRDLSFEVVVTPMIGAVLLCVLMTLFGFGLGAVMRQPAGAIPVFLIWPLIIEGIVSLILDSVDESLVRWLPFRSAQELVNFTDASGIPVFSRAVSGLYFAGWTAAVVMIGWWLVERRDA